MSRPSIRPDRLRWMIATALLAPAWVTPALANPPTPAAGPMGTPVAHGGPGVPVIDIVAPNAHGVSQNRFIDYNVGAAGLVINNALQAGDSVLAGVLQANPHFQGQTASAIIHQVIGQHASSILGPQEIFGQAADYILANPNGITVNGASFINVARAAFLVGTPTLEDGRITRLTTQQAQGTLVIDGAGISHAGAVALLTPTLQSRGPIKADGGLTVILGHNRIDANSLEVLDTAPHDPATPPIDAVFVGAMQAERIRIVSTRAGAGVRLPREVLSRQGVSVEGAGDISISGSGGTRLQRARISGGDGDVHLQAATDLVLTAVDVDARDIIGKAGRHLRIDAATARRLEQQREQYQRKAWFIPTEEFSQARDVDHLEHGGSELLATGAIDLHAGGRMDVVASRVIAGGRLSASAGDELLIDGRADRSELTETVRHRKHLWRGDSDRHEVTESAVGSQLRGGEVALHSDTRVHVRGSQVHSDNGLSITAKDEILVDSVRLEDVGSVKQSRGDALGGVFKNQRDSAHSQQTHHVGSQIVANGNQQLLSDGELTLEGSSASAGGRLVVNGKQAVRLQAALDAGETQNATREQGFMASARQTRDAEDGKPGSQQYSASVGYQVSQRERNVASGSHQPSTLSAGEIAVVSERLIELGGARLTSTAGETLLDAPQVDLLANIDRQQETTTSRVSEGNLQLGGGIDRLSSAFTGSDDHQRHATQRGTAQVSQVEASGDLRIRAERVLSEGAQVRAGGELLSTANEQVNRAVDDSVSESRDGTHWQGALGASLEYRDLTRPIEKLVLGQEQTRFQQPGVEDALAPPSLGIDIDLSRRQRQASTTSNTPRVSEFQGASLDQQVSGTLVDHATRYISTEGGARIEAGQHELLAVAQVNQSSVKRLDVEGGLRVDSTTGADLNVRLSGLGGSVDRQRRDELAVVGSLGGKAGVQVQLGTDGRYEGARFDGGGAGVTVKAGGSLDFAQANDARQVDDTTIDGSAWAKVGSSPAAGKSFGGSGIGDYRQAASLDRQARAVQFDGQGAISAVAGGNLRMEGGRIGSEDAKVASIELRAGGSTELLAAVDTHSASGTHYGGGLQPTLGASGDGRSGGLGGSLKLGRTDEASRTLTGGDFHSAAASAFGAGARAPEALHLEGLKVAAGSIDLAASQGGILVEAASSSARRDNKDLGVGLAMNASRLADASQNATALYGRATLKRDRLDSLTHANAHLRADEGLGLDSRGDTRLAGANLQAGAVSGGVGGDWRVESRQDQVNGLTLDIDAKLSGEKNPQGLLNGVSAFAGPAAAQVKDKVGSKIQLFDTGLTPSLDASLVKLDRDTVGQATTVKARDGIELRVDGDSFLSGAQLKAAQGGVDLGNGALHRATLAGSDYRAEAVVDLSNAPVDLVQGIMEAAKRKASGETAFDLGLIRAGGHDTRQVLTSGIE
jgi:hemolysin